jgi:hypothetical protein
MLSVPIDQVVRTAITVRNPRDHELVIVLEPWAELHRLQPDESLDVVFAGPAGGRPEVLPYVDELAIYGWEGSEVYAFRGNRLALRQPTVDEIIEQELQITALRGRFHLERSAGEIADAQAFLDSSPEFGRAAQRAACKRVGHLIHDIALDAGRSPAEIALIWQIAGRILSTKGLALAAAPPPDSFDVLALVDALERNSLSVLPWDSASSGLRSVEDADAATRRFGRPSGQSAR